MGRRVVIEADGGSRGNPGPAGYGAVVRDADTGEILAERAAGIGVASNNVAEYRGLIAGLTAAVELSADAVDVAMDSKLVVMQMSGAWQVKHPDMKVLAREAAGLVRQLPRVTFRHIPRDRNKHADRLANEAMDAQATGRAWQAQLVEQVPEPSPPPQRKLYGWSTETGRRTTLWLVRHGETPHTAEKRFSGRSDLPLSDLGRRQATAAAERVAALVPDGTVIVSSPLRRARQTAAQVASVTGLNVVVDAGFAETDFGHWDGATLAEVEEKWPQELAAWLADSTVPPPGGESMAATFARVRAARDAVISSYGGGDVVLVAHVTPIKVLIADAIGSGPELLYRMHMSPASVSAIDWYDERNEGVLSLFNDTSHLGELAAVAGA